MECLLISGYPRTGKNLNTVRLAYFLLGLRYQHVGGDPIPPSGSNGNFIAVLEHPETHRRILLNTKSDYVVNATELINFYQNHQPIDILIQTIRDGGLERSAMESAIQSLQPVHVIEIPLARISGRRPDFATAINDYPNRVEALARFILQGLPFQV